MSIPPLSKEEILSRLTRVLVDTFELDPGDIRPTANLIEDLDLDSIDLIDLAVQLEEETGLDLEEAELKQIRIVQDVVDLVQRKVGD
jgi:acyl carrier protein